VQQLLDASNSTLPELGTAETDPDACARAMLDGLPPVMWFIRRQVRRHRSHRLSVPQYRALCLLDRIPTASLSEVADHLGAALPTASRMVSNLVAKGLAVRKPCVDDRRQVALELTPKGRKAYEGAQRETQESLAAELEGLNDKQRATIADAMRLMGHVFLASDPTLQKG
jgi:DNA-binding MarR family transcriptional regulator